MTPLLATAIPLAFLATCPAFCAWLIASSNRDDRFDVWEDQ